MNRYRYFLLALLFLGLPSVAIASGVLLPQDTGTGTSLPNLGLGTSETQAPAQPKPEPSTPATAASETPKTPAPVTATKTTPNPVTTTITPGGTVAKSEKNDELTNLMNRFPSNKQSNTSPSLNLQIEKMKKILEADREKNAPPPTFINDTPILNLSGIRLPYALTIAVATNYLWGAKDVRNIYNTLGYTAEQIPQQCQLRLDAALATTKSIYLSKIYSGQWTSIKYDGAFSSLSFTPMAVCNPPANVPKSGLIIRLAGNKYAVQLSAKAACPLPAKTQSAPSSLTVTYNGDGQAQCAYQ